MTYSSFFFFLSLFQDAFLSVASPLHKNPKQAAHPNMRTYYFCTDTAKEMESWMKVMTDAALVQAEPVKRFVPVLSLCQGGKKYSVIRFEWRRICCFILVKSLSNQLSAHKGHFLCPLEL